MNPRLEADRIAIQAFVSAMFRYADEGTYVSLRAFDQENRGLPPVAIEGVPINGSFDHLVERAASIATRVANGERPVVFSPPVATFHHRSRARGQDVANGVVLSAELDTKATEGLRKLELLLGPATMVIASGGEWTDPDTGEIGPKLHVHFRLSEPTRTAEEHAQLQEARRLAAALVDGDESATPIVHPLRWPGSVHRKGTPKLATILHSNPDAEIHLDDAIEKLSEAVEAAGQEFAEKVGLGHGDGPRVSGKLTADPEMLASALAAIPNEDLPWSQWNLIGVAMCTATGGSEVGFKAFDEWSRKSAKYNGNVCLERWKHFIQHPLNRMGAGTVYFLAGKAGWKRPKEPQPDPPPGSAGDPGWQPPGNETADQAPPDAVQLIRNREGSIKPLTANLALLFGSDPQLKGLFGFNEFTLATVATRPPPAWYGRDVTLAGPYPRPRDANDVQHVIAYLQGATGAAWTKVVVQDAVDAEARHTRSHPVREWLDSLRWDGRSRLTTWLENAFDALHGVDCETKDGQDKIAYIRAVARKMLIAAVRRIRQPGVKFDQMPIIEGDQGIGKSKLIAQLFGQEWFTDNLPSDLENKDTAHFLCGVWCIECAEIQHLIRSEPEVVKAFLSRSVDRFRPPYGRDVGEFPRQCVIIGTTNSDSYLRDVTGNRRFWPIQAKCADEAWVRVNRDQLWAEAAAAEATGEAIWLDNETIRTTADTLQSDRMEEDVWTDAITQYANSHDDVTIAVLLREALFIEVAHQDRRALLRATSILTRLGWHSAVIRTGSKTARVWRRKVRRPDPSTVTAGESDAGSSGEHD